MKHRRARPAEAAESLLFFCLLFASSSRFVMPDEFRATTETCISSRGHARAIRVASLGDEWLRTVQSLWPFCSNNTPRRGSGHVYQAATARLGKGDDILGGTRLDQQSPLPITNQLDHLQIVVCRSVIRGQDNLFFLFIYPFIFSFFSLSFLFLFHIYYYSLLCKSCPVYCRAGLAVATRTRVVHARD